MAELELDEKSCSDDENGNEVISTLRPAANAVVGTLRPAVNAVIDLVIGTLALHLPAPAPLPTNAVAVRRAKPPNNGIGNMATAQISNFAGDCAQTASMVASLVSFPLWNDENDEAVGLHVCMRQF